jgi:hypothetical protein
MDASVGSNVRYAGVASTGSRKARLKFLCWGPILQGLSTPVDKLAGESVQLSLAEARYMNAFGEVWSEKAVRVFVCHFATVTEDHN